MGFKRELRILQTLPDSKALTVNEFDAAAEKQVSESERNHDPELQSPQATGIQGYLTRIDQRWNLDPQEYTSTGIQRELTRLDQQWEIDRQRYYSKGRSYYLPTKTHGLMKGIVGLLIGVVWIALSLSMAEDSVVPCVFGVVVTCAVCWGGCSDYSKAVRYEKAKGKYWHQRDMLVAQKSMR